MPYDFTYMWNLKNKINEQTEQTDSKTQTTFGQLPDQNEVGGMGEKGKEIKKHKLLVTE